MTDDAKSFLFDLLDTPSPTGFEAPGQRVWAEYIRDYADAVESDAYGTAWATLHGTADDAPRVMLDAHVDEIGFMVRHITDDGFIHINRIGGSDRAIARGLRVRILGDDGPVTGVVGNTAIHIRDTKNEKSPTTARRGACRPPTRCRRRSGGTGQKWLRIASIPTPPLRST